MKNHIKKDRLHIHNIVAFNLTIYYISAVLAVTLLLLPVFYSCTSTAPETAGTERNDREEKTELTFKTDKAVKGYIDILYFNDDRLRRLDSYMRAELGGSGRTESASRAGKKILVTIANSPLNEEEYRKVLAYDDLQNLYAELKADNPDAPVMYAENRVNAGYERECEIALTPLLARITLNSISCDFHGRPYEGKSLEDVCVYLTDVCGRFPVCGKATTIPESILNAGKLEPSDTAGFTFGNLICSRRLGNIGETVRFPETELFCYQNKISQEGLGAGFTKLVIEGTLDGERTWYPIEINRGQWCNTPDSAGVQAGKDYIFDITLTRRGVSSPDIAINLSTVNCKFSVKPWTIKDEKTITY